MNQFQDRKNGGGGTQLNAATFREIQKNHGIRLYKTQLTENTDLPFGNLMESDYLGEGDYILDQLGQIGRVLSFSPTARTMRVELTDMTLVPAACTAANENAQSALNTANTANTNASTAMNTAGTANTAAQQALTTARDANTALQSTLNTAENAERAAETAARLAAAAESQADSLVARANLGEFNGADGANGIVTPIAGSYVFQIRDDNLIVVYDGNAAPAFALNANGELIHHF